MPNPLIPAIIGSIIESVVDAPPPRQPVLPPYVGEPALPRMLPADARRAQMNDVAIGEVVINGTNLRMSPAAQIRNEYNMIVVPSMAPRPALIRYTTDAMGLVHRIWVLSAVEAAQPDLR